MNEALNRQLEFQKIISDIAKAFVNIEDLDGSINSSIEKLGKFSDASRVYIFEVDHKNKLMSNTYEWCNKNISCEIEGLQNLPISVFPWWIKKLSSGEIINVPNVSDLGEDALAEKEILQAQGVISVLVLPIIYDDELKGYVGFDHNIIKAPWVDEDESILKIASEFYSNVFQRLKQHMELTASNQALQKSLKALEQAQIKIYQQEKSVAVWQLAAGIAHEINNPLSFVVSNQEWVKEFIDELYEIIIDKDIQIDATLNEKYAEIDEMFLDSRNGLERILNIVKSLKSFAENYDELSFKQYDFNEGINNILRLLDFRIKDRVEVVLDIDPKHSIIYADQYKMNDVLLSILTNALDAMEEKKDSAKLSIHLKSVEDRVVLTVKDNGLGMSKHIKNQIFNPFFTTKTIGANKGLGLNIVYDIIKNIHKGEIEIISFEGESTEIIISLPKDQRE